MKKFEITACTIMAGMGATSIGFAILDHSASELGCGMGFMISGIMYALLHKMFPTR